MIGLLFGAGILAVVACGGEQASSGTHEVSNADGGMVYGKYCAVCHGKDGKQQTNGAKDLTLSQMPVTDREALIKSGKNLMTPFKGILSDGEVTAVAHYTMSLK